MNSTLQFLPLSPGEYMHTGVVLFTSTHVPSPQSRSKHVLEALSCPSQRGPVTAAYNGQLPMPTPQPCTNVDCGRDTTCMQVEGTPVCMSVNESTCEPNPCASGGFCVPDEVMGFICECLEGMGEERWPTRYKRLGN